MVALKVNELAQPSPSFINPPPKRVVRPFSVRSATTAPLQNELVSFIQSAKHQHRARAWLENEDIKVYVRKAVHNIEGKSLTTLDIANVEVAEDRRGQGIFTRFLNMAHEHNPWDATYIENAQDDRFANYFWTRDWELLDDYSRSFYKKKNHGTFSDAWMRQRTKLVP
jgi:hypothetical protein